MNECTQMHSKYGALVRSYVTLKLDSTQDQQNQMQKLQNISTLLSSFVNDVHIILPKVSQSAPISQAAPVRPNTATPVTQQINQNTSAQINRVNTVSQPVAQPITG